MLDRLLLQGVHLADLVFQGRLQELLPLRDCFRNLSHLFNRVPDVALCLFTDHGMLHGLLVTHFFDEVGDLLHGGLHLGHDTFLAVQSRLLAPLLR